MTIKSGCAGYRVTGGGKRCALKYVSRKSTTIFIAVEVVTKQVVGAVVCAASGIIDYTQLPTRPCLNHHDLPPLRQGLSAVIF